MANDFSALIDRAAPTVLAAARVIEDPALPEVTCQVLRLHTIAAGQPVGAPCKRIVITDTDKRKGIGLYAARDPLRAYVWARQHPLLATLVGVGIVGGLYYLGYSAGKGKRA